MKVRSVMMVLLVLSLSIAIFNLEVDGSEPVQFKDFASLVDTFDNGTFSGLEKGDQAVFVDTVTITDYNDAMRNTMVWLESTGGSVFSPNLTFPGDLTGELLPGSRVEFTVRIMEIMRNGETEQIIIADTVNIVIIEEGEKGDTLVKRDQIDVFGIIKINKNDLPESLRSTWARFGLSLLIWMVLIIVLWFLFRLLLLFTKKTRIDMDHTVVGIIRFPFFLLMLVYGVIVSLSQLDVPDNVIAILDTLFRAMAVILVAIVAVRIFKKVIMVYLKIMSKKTETEADDVLVPVIGKIITVIIWVLASITFFRTFGFDATALLGAVGVAGLVIAFAAQDTLSNFFAGIMILLDRPFKEGDWIIFDDSVYQVKDIGIRSTRLFSSWTNQMVTLPNSKMSNLVFSNLTEPDIFGRKTVEIGVSYDSDIDRVKKIVIESVDSHPGVHHDDDHAILFRFNKFGDNSLIFAVTFYVTDYNNQWSIASDIRDTVYRRFKEEGVEIPFPQRVIHMAYKNDDGVPGGEGKGPINGPASMKNLSP